MIQVGFFFLVLVDRSSQPISQSLLRIPSDTTCLCLSSTCHLLIWRWVARKSNNIWVVSIKLEQVFFFNLLSA